jgi:DNA (cytosine-5)-methyltransferase 1
MYNEKITEETIVQEPLGELFGYKELYPKIQRKDTKELRVVSLFSGCGGLDLGFNGDFDFRNKHYEKNNCSVIFSNDIDKAASHVYNNNLNFFKHKIIHDDIRNITEQDVPEFDFLIGGFPCQPFSNAGLRKGFEDDRGDLFEDAIRIFEYGLKQKNKPIGFLFENVRGILSTKMPDGTLIPDEIVKRAEKLGYKTNYKLIQSSEYGVPSNRFRVIIIGLREDIGYFDFNLLHQVVQKYNIPNIKTNPYDLFLGSVLCDIPENASGKNDFWGYSPAGQFMIEKIGTCTDGQEQLTHFKSRKPLQEISPTISKGKSWKDMKYEDMTERFRKIYDDPKKYHAPNFYRRFALGEINGTITASAQPENCGITHPFENRRFTIREIARIQSFPDEFIFPYTKIADAYKVIGNAVPPVLGWVLAKSLTELIKQKI